MDKAPRFLVSDFMNKKPVTLDGNATYQDAVRVMSENNTNGLVVLHRDGTVAGILSSWDLIEYLVPDYLEKDKHLAAFEAAEIFEQRAKEIAHTPIVEFMSQHVHTVKPSDSLMNASTLLSEFKIRQLPVVDDNGKLVGYLNRTDIKRAIQQVLTQ